MSLPEHFFEAEQRRRISAKEVTGKAGEELQILIYSLWEKTVLPLLPVK